MRAAVLTRYGPPEVVHVIDVQKPVPGDNEVLVRVRASTVCAADCRLRKADPFVARLFTGLLRPSRVKILGMEFAGVVESVGKAVNRFRPGDEVFGGTLFKLGTHAEYVCLAEDGMLAMKPANLPTEDAAAFFFGCMTVLSFLSKAKIEPGQKVLVYGASGSVGVFAVQLAKHFGAHVTGVCSTANLDLVQSLGADEVVDYTSQDFSRAGRIYDMVFDAVGKSGFRRSMRCLKRGGFYVRVDHRWTQWFMVDMLAGMLCGMWASVTGTAKVVGMGKRGNIDQLLMIKSLIEAGKLRTVIEKRYSLDQIADAHRHADTGHKKGHVLIVCS